MPEEQKTQEADPKYTAELEKFDKATGEETSSNKETSENGEESRLVEKDGELYLSSESEDTEPVEEPVKGESNTETEEPDDAANLENESDIYAKKSREEIIEMHTNAQKKIGVQGDELGKLRDVAKKTEDLTADEIFDRLSADDIADGVKTEKQKLDEMDPYDTKTRDAQSELIRDLEDDLITKRTQENISARMNKRDNEKFIQQQKQLFKDQGIDLSDDEFKTVSEKADRYAEDGLITEGAYHKALVDQYGLAHVVKNLSMKGEKKARADIQKATAKTTEKVDVKGSGKSSKLVKIADLGRQELKKTLNNLSVEDLQKLRNQYVK